MTRPDAGEAVVGYGGQSLVAPRLSILDQSPIGEGSTAGEALRASVELAEAADELGVTRYWVAEHHGSPGFAGTAPEILVPIILGATRRMRVGSGGVLLPRYPATKVAEVFSILADLYPGRVDLGLGRAGGPPETFPADVADLRRWLGDDPHLWVLGASASSGALAAKLGTAYAYAHFLNPGPGLESMTAYHEASPAPSSALAVRVIVADTESHANDLAASLLLWRSRKDLGDDRPLPSIETARNHRWTSAELERASYNSKALISGTPDQVAPILSDLAYLHGTDELVVNVLTHDPADRLRTYQLLAQVLGAASTVGTGAR
ncbi:MsnO8 family LLM class oxidoreductase [Kribbella qitaiheensis]|uniref:MsnO8 family LLM class oxidoreductase n=2 Tax=Kribbella qitaiheensis TaxID=1544730 RepID=A0A7G6XAE5_9ACTN|nr:MsnO8 family LLM class oxidoreductase [Kribbella qitaiheensis]